MIRVYGYDACTYCKKAVELLKKNGQPFEYYDIKDDQHKDQLALLKAKGFTTVPQIYFNEHHLGGYEELAKLFDMGLL